MSVENRTQDLGVGLNPEQDWETFLRPAMARRIKLEEKIKTT